MNIMLHHVEGADVEKYEYFVNGQILEIKYNDIAYRIDFTDFKDGVLINPPDLQGFTPLIMAKKYQGVLTIGLLSATEIDNLATVFTPKESELSDDFEFILVEWSADEQEEIVMTDAEILRTEFLKYKTETESKIQLLETRLHNLEHSIKKEHETEIED